MAVAAATADYNGNMELYKVDLFDTHNRNSSSKPPKMPNMMQFTLKIEIQK